MTTSLRQHANTRKQIEMHKYFRGKEKRGAQRGKQGGVTLLPDVTVNALTSFCMWHLINMARAHKQNGDDSFTSAAPLKACNAFLLLLLPKQTASCVNKHEFKIAKGS